MLCRTRVPRACSSSIPVSKNSKPLELANEPSTIWSAYDSGIILDCFQTADLLRYTASVQQEANEARRNGEPGRAAALTFHLVTELTDHIVRLQEALDGR